ncbi:MAG: triose-phosphate isomerase, partial [Gammaproteobacteria bacterium]
MRQTLVAGNWKMNGSRESIRILLDGIKAGLSDVNSAEMAVCCPSVYISDVCNQLDGTEIAYGGQDISIHDKGAYTGEIS